MKIVKLDRRYLSYREHNHIIAVRFNSYMDSPRRLIEESCEKLLGPSVMWNKKGNWYSYLGSRNSTGYTTYWVSFKNESDLTLVLLKMPHSS